METTMWKPLMNTNFFIKFFKSSFHVVITNFKKCWTVLDFNKKTILDYLKESNDGLEFDDENELVNRGIDMLSNPETLKNVSIRPGSCDTLTILLTKHYEITLRLELSLVESSSEHFFEVVTQPLLKTICDLHSSQHELREALLKKDREIEEYKIEGRAPRRLITTIYDDVEHMKKHTAFEENFGADHTEISELLTDLDAKKRKMLPNSTSVQTNKPTLFSSNESCKTELVKVEKCSQETVIKENTSIPIQIKEKVITETIKSTEDVKIHKKESLPSPRKRLRNKLNL